MLMTITNLPLLVQMVLTKLASNNLPLDMLSPKQVVIFRLAIAINNFSRDEFSGHELSGRNFPHPDADSPCGAKVHLCTTDVQKYLYQSLLLGKEVSSVDLDTLLGKFA